MRIKPDMCIIEVLETYPETKLVFIHFGMGCLECMGASMETLEDGARMHCVDLDNLLTALNLAIKSD